MFDSLDDLAQGNFWANIVDLVTKAVKSLYDFLTDFIGDFQDYFAILPPEIASLLVAFYSMLIGIAIYKIVASFI